MGLSWKPATTVSPSCDLHTYTGKEKMSCRKDYQGDITRVSVSSNIEINTMYKML